jgi:hypothetical protein
MLYFCSIIIIQFITVTYINYLQLKHLKKNWILRFKWGGFENDFIEVT